MLEAYIIDWLNLLGRWVHMITGIAWIGASFYFIWLDNHLQPVVESADTDKGVSGEVWSVHGGGFYHAQKYQVAPPTLPEKLNWFKWEAYTTWLSGMFMLSLMYWYGAEIYLIDPSVADISKPVAIAIGAACIILGWLAYDWLCKSSIGGDEKKMAAVMFVVLSLLAWGLCQVFSGRGAYIHFGALLGTIMVANVFFVIIPGQKDLVAAKQAGRAPDPIHGIRGKQRSVHNTYFTLPVLFVMMSNHYAMTHAHAYNWLILIVISVAGALIRVFFVARHKGSTSPVPLLLGFALLGGLAAILVPSVPSGLNHSHNDSAKDEAVSNAVPVTMEQVRTVMNDRCVSCHADQPTQVGFSVAPMGIVLVEDEQIERRALSIYQQAVVSKAMPIGNLTGMTDEERDIVARWYLQQAK